MKRVTSPGKIATNGEKEALLATSPLTPFDMAANKFFDVSNKSKLTEQAKQKKQRREHLLSILYLAVFAGIIFAIYRSMRTETPKKHRFSDLKAHKSDRQQMLKELGLADIAEYTCDANVCFPREFVPTSEWQEVYHGQIIGSNVEIRMNLLTGKQEGKLKENQSPFFGYTNDFKFMTDGHFSQEMYSLRTHLLQERTWRQQQGIEGDVKYHHFIDILINPQSNSEEIQNALNQLDASHFNYFDGALDGEGFEILGLLLQKNDAKIRERAAAALAKELSDDPLGQKIATKHRILSILINVLSVETSSKTLVSLLDATLLNIQHNPEGLNTFFRSNGFELLHKIYEGSSDSAVRAHVMSFVADIFLVERTFVDQQVSIDVQWRFLNVHDWCILLQKHFCGTSDDSVVFALEAIEGLVLTDVMHYGNAYKCPIQSEFIEKFKKYTPKKGDTRAKTVHDVIQKMMKIQ